MKICKSCGEEKPLSEFSKNRNSKDGYENICKSCKKEYYKQYYLNNHQKIQEKHKKYNQLNRDKVRKYYNEYERNKRKTDPIYRLKDNIRRSVRRAIKIERTEKIIGCTYQELKLHLESQFTEGMSWQNYGEWHIDHIRPLSWYDLNDPDEVAKANHFSNLQPLWAEENWSKGNRFE